MLMEILLTQEKREPKHVEWVRAWLSLLEEQRKYVMEFHTTGLAWNPKVSDSFYCGSRG